jgi:hypothetical protein
LCACLTSRLRDTSWLVLVLVLVLLVLVLLVPVLALLLKPVLLVVVLEVLEIAAARQRRRPVVFPGERRERRGIYGKCCCRHAGGSHG